MFTPFAIIWYSADIQNALSDEYSLFSRGTGTFYKYYAGQSGRDCVTNGEILKWQMETGFLSHEKRLFEEKVMSPDRKELRWQLF